jgi:enoyl-CoA hydratase
MSNQEVILTEIRGVGGDIGLITLNRPQHLNALNHTMIHAIYPALQQWAAAEHIKAVIINAQGRAFCAGGDLRLVYNRWLAHEPHIERFFDDEYQLNQAIFHFPKPYIALLDGITMGGGVGLSIHGSHRVVTERIKFAMPETGIGFYPDVGGTYFLPRLRNHLGFYLGLTGIVLNADDCVELEIAQHKVLSDTLPALIQALAQTPFAKDAFESVSEVIAEFGVTTHALSDFFQKTSSIEACFKEKTIEEIIQQLTTSAESLCRETATLLQKKSPTALKVTLCALQQGATLAFDACMHEEYTLTKNFLKGHDFMEGIRALIIDKDQSPNWQPDSLDKVTEQIVAGYFADICESAGS